MRTLWGVHPTCSFLALCPVEISGPVELHSNQSTTNDVLLGRGVFRDANTMMIDHLAT